MTRTDNQDRIGICNCEFVRPREATLNSGSSPFLSGLKIGWAFAWRNLIAAERVFSASSERGGLGWYIAQNRNEMYTDKVFAGLALVIVIGLAVESPGFQTLERLTIRRRGAQR